MNCVHISIIRKGRGGVCGDGRSCGMVYIFALQARGLGWGRAGGREGRGWAGSKLKQVKSS